MTPQALLGLALDGLRTNFWGLGCPQYCTQPSIGLVRATFLLGLFVGVAGVVIVVLRLYPVWSSAASSGSPAASSSAPLSRAALLASYLHEQSSVPIARRRS